jgi:protocatechuate 3,4-dioxygenase beta subunit
VNLLPPSGPGSFFRSGAPQRAQYVLQGCVLDERKGTPVDALVEVWHAVQVGGRCAYSEAPSWRGRWSFHTRGRFAIHSPVPCAYADERSHIHLRISAPGYVPYVTRVYPSEGVVECGLVSMERI